MDSGQEAIPANKPDADRVLQSDRQTRTPAARWNKQLLKQLKSAFRRDPEADLSAQFVPSYARILQSLRNRGNITYTTYIIY